MNFFESKNYTPFMFVAISLVTLLILFNFVNILGDTKSGVESENRRVITGLTVDGVEGDKENNEKEIVEEEEKEELYTVQSYFAYYVIIIILGICIFVLSFRYFLPFLKRNS